jgi:hypothetical protein
MKEMFVYASLVCLPGLLGGVFSGCWGHLGGVVANKTQCSLRGV